MNNKDYLTILITAIAPISVLYLDKFITKRKEAKKINEEKLLVKAIVSNNLPLIESVLKKSIVDFTISKEEFSIDRVGNYGFSPPSNVAFNVIKDIGYPAFYSSFEPEINTIDSFSKFWTTISIFDDNRAMLKDQFNKMVLDRKELNHKWNITNHEIMVEITRIRKSYHDKETDDNDFIEFVKSIEYILKDYAFKEDITPTFVLKHLIQPLNDVITNLKYLNFYNAPELPQLFSLSEGQYNDFIAFMDNCQQIFTEYCISYKKNLEIIENFKNDFFVRA